MIEKFKSTLLFILMANSLVLSGLLWYKQPGGFYTPANNLSNSESLQIGKPLKIEDVFQPKKVIFHLGNSQQTCALPESDVFQTIKKSMPRWNFYNYSVIQFTKEQWSELMDKKKGIEIQFPLSVPVEMIPSLLGSVGLSNYMNEVNRLWIYEDSEQQYPIALFLSDKEKKIIMARSTLASGDLNQYFSREKGLGFPPYIPFKRITDNKGGKVYQEIDYLPKEQLELAQYRYFYLQITQQQAVNALFPDPQATRQLPKEGGEEFITDGSRALTISDTMDSFVYLGPGPQGGGNGTFTMLNSIVNGVNFINAHGGFGGDYLLDSIEDLSPPQKKQINIFFREKIGSYPVYTDAKSKQHMINLQSNLGTVTRYQRSMYNLDTYFEKTFVKVLSGPELLETLKGKEAMIKGIDLGYQAKLENDYIQMVPVWVINYVSGGREMIPASMQTHESQEEK